MIFLNYKFVLFSCIIILITYYIIVNIIDRGDRSVTLTEEQKAIVKHPLLPGHVWKIIAFAGK